MDEPLTPLLCVEDPLGWLLGADDGCTDVFDDGCKLRIEDCPELPDTTPDDPECWELANEGCELISDEPDCGLPLPLLPLGMDEVPLDGALD